MTGKKKEVKLNRHLFSKQTGQRFNESVNPTKRGG